jgi:hypothetical protein
MVRNHARFGVPPAAIAALAHCSVSTLLRRCKKELELGRAEFERNVRFWQYESARTKNVTMLKWLGQAEFGQTAKPANDADPEPELDSKVG